MKKKEINDVLIQIIERLIEKGIVIVTHGNQVIKELKKIRDNE
jgi:hypothetical protein